jgi:hypothetical protein
VYIHGSGQINKLKEYNCNNLKYGVCQKEKIMAYGKEKKNYIALLNLSALKTIRKELGSAINFQCLSL